MSICEMWRPYSKLVCALQAATLKNKHGWQIPESKFRNLSRACDWYNPLISNYVSLNESSQIYLVDTCIWSLFCQAIYKLWAHYNHSFCAKAEQWTSILVSFENFQVMHCVLISCNIGSWDCGQIHVMQQQEMVAMLNSASLIINLLNWPAETNIVLGCFLIDRAVAANMVCWSDFNSQLRWQELQRQISLW